MRGFLAGRTVFVPNAEQTERRERSRSSTSGSVRSVSGHEDLFASRGIPGFCEPSSRIANPFHGFRGPSPTSVLVGAAAWGFSEKEAKTGQETGSTGSMETLKRC